MNDTQRTRILLLLIAGVLLVGGSLLWVNTNREGTDDIAMQQSAQLQAVLNRRKHAHLTKTAEIAAQAPAASLTGPNLNSNAGAKNVAGNPENRQSQTKTNNSLVNPVARLSSVNSVKEKLEKMMVGTGLMPASTAQPAVNAAVNVVAANPATITRNLAATPMDQAIAESRTNAGRKNPFQDISGFQSFPRAGAAANEANEEATGESAEAKSIAKPSAKALAQKVSDKVNGKGTHNALALVPPPPPVSPSLANGGVSLDELPSPPVRPSIADKMKVMAVIGDHVLIMFTDKKAQMENNWPKTISLGPGEKFESVSLIKVGDDSVTFDDDGERTVKTVDPIK